VRNVEMLNETVLECVKDLRGVGRHETVILDDDVRRQGVRTGRHRPYVEVVDVENVRNFAEGDFRMSARTKLSGAAWSKIRPASRSSPHAA